MLCRLARKLCFVVVLVSCEVMCCDIVRCDVMRCATRYYVQHCVVIRRALTGDSKPPHPPSYSTLLATPYSPLPTPHFLKMPQLPPNKYRKTTPNPKTATSKTSTRTCYISIFSKSSQYSPGSAIVISKGEASEGGFFEGRSFRGVDWCKMSEVKGSRVERLIWSGV